jgi:uncharacterized membrane protein YczE
VDITLIVVGLALALGAVGLGYIWRAVTGGPTKHEQSAQYKRIKRAVDDSERQEQDKGGD